MKKIYFIILSFIMLNGYSYGQTADGLTMNLTGDGNALDQSGNTSHGIIQGGVSYESDRNGNLSSAFSFNGTSSYIDINSALGASGQDTEGTLSTWVKSNNPISPEQHLLAYTRSNHYTYITLRIRDGKVTVYSKVNGGSGDFHYSTTDVVIQQGEWHHVAVTQDGTTGLNIFIDGILVPGTYVWTKDKLVWFKKISDNNGNKLFLGASYYNNSIASYFNGALDDVRIYNRVLSHSEIAELANPPATCPASMTVASSELVQIDACNGVSFGSYEITEVGEDGAAGTGPYEYTFYDSGDNIIQPTSSASIISGLALGSYSVVINNTSINCESGSINFEIQDQSILPQLEISEIQDNTSLNTPNGQLTVGVLNPNGGLYTYSWFAGSDVNDNSIPVGSVTAEVSEVSNTISNLSGGNYWVSVDQGEGGTCHSKISTALVDNIPSSEWIVDGGDVSYTGGNVSIGTSVSDATLTVKGDIHAERVRVDLNIPAPDYVFEADYDLRSLEEIASYIKANKHLPEVPSAKELKANGIDLVEMNMLLLKKIEELTLHVIDLKKENEVQKQRLEKIESNLSTANRK